MPAMAKRSVVRSFQISSVFVGLTVRENIELALLPETGLAWNLLGRISRHRAVLDRAMRCSRASACRTTSCSVAALLTLAG